MVSLALPVRSVRIKTFLEKIVIKVGSRTSYLSGQNVDSWSQSKNKILKLKKTKNWKTSLSHSCWKNFPLSVCLFVQSVTVCLECVIKVQMVMDSVCVSHRTPGRTVTKVRP